MHKEIEEVQIKKMRALIYLRMNWDVRCEAILEALEYLDSTLQFSVVQALALRVETYIMFNTEV